MDCGRSGRFMTIFIGSLLFAMCFQQMLAARPLEGEQWVEKNFIIQNLFRGPVPPSRASGCTYIPGGSGRCTLSEMNVAGHVAHPPPAFPDVLGHVAHPPPAFPDVLGHVAHPPPAFPDVTLNSAVASISKQTPKQDSSF